MHHTSFTTYWEGICVINGTYKDQKASGLGYTELTGYAEPLSIQPPPPDDPAHGK